jgi:hypothetical protein
MRMNEKQFYLIWCFLVGMFCTAAVIVLVGPHIGYETIFILIKAIMVVWMVYGLASENIRPTER